MNDVDENKVIRYWVSWYSGNYADEGCTAPPFQFWVSGYRDRSDDSDRNDCTLCAVIDSTSEEEIWRVIAKHFPDFEQRDCTKKEIGYIPGDRFPGFEGRTSLYGIV